MRKKRSKVSFTENSKSLLIALLLVGMTLLVYNQVQAQEPATVSHSASEISGGIEASTLGGLAAADYLQLIADVEVNPNLEILPTKPACDVNNVGKMVLESDSDAAFYCSRAGWKGIDFFAEPDNDGDEVDGIIAGGTDCNDFDEDRWQLLSGYPDLDGDTYTTAQAPICSGDSLPLGALPSASTSPDCDDDCADCNPDSTVWTPTTDGLDQDCDGTVDEQEGGSNSVTCGGNPTYHWVSKGQIQDACTTYCSDIGSHGGTVTCAHESPRTQITMALFYAPNTQSCAGFGSVQPYFGNNACSTKSITCKCGPHYR